MDTVGLVGVDELGVLLTRRGPGDKAVSSRSGEELVAVLVGGQGGVRAGGLPVDVPAVDVLPGEVGLEVVPGRRCGAGEGAGRVLLVAGGEVLHRLGGIVVQLVSASSLGDVSVVGRVVERQVREGRVGLVEGDVDETAVLEGGRFLDEGDVVAQPQVGGVEATGVVLRWGCQGLGVVRATVGVEETGQVVALACSVVGV